MLSVTSFCLAEVVTRRYFASRLSSGAVTFNVNAGLLGKVSYTNGVFFYKSHLVKNSPIVVRKIPVAFFAYNRPEHTVQALDALAACHKRELFEFYFFSDGAKTEAELPTVRAVRHILAEKAAKFSAKIIESPNNLGLAKSVIHGVSYLCSEFGCVVVVEDDLIVNPDFLHFMASALERYEKDSCVMQVGGYTIAPPPNLKIDSFFLPVTTTWGWGTWARAWKQFSSIPKGWPETRQDQSWLSLFQINGAGNYASMLEERLAGRNDSWGILWWYAVSRCRGQVLYPRNSLVWNSGFDGSGVHCGAGSGIAWQYAPVKTRIFGDSISFPKETRHRSSDFDLFERALRGQSIVPAGLRLRLRSLLRRWSAL